MPEPVTRPASPADSSAVRRHDGRRCRRPCRRRRRRSARRPRLRGAGGAGPRRHGRRLQGPAADAGPRRGPQDDPGRRLRRAGGGGPASEPRPRRWAACSIRTSCRSSRSAKPAGRPFFALEYVEGGSLDRKLAGTPQPPREAAALVETLARAVHAAHQRQRRPPRPQAGQHPADGRRRSQDHRLRPGQAARRGGPDRQRRGDGHAQLHGARTGRGRTGESAPPPTSTRWARSSTSC